MIGNEQAVHMKHRQRVQQHVAFAEFPEVHQHPGVRSKVAVCDHRPFGASGRARSVDNHRGIVRLQLCGSEIVRSRACRAPQGTAAILVQGDDARAAAAQFLHQLCCLRPAHDHPGLGISEKVRQLAALVCSIERQIYQPRAQAAEIQEQRRGGFLHLHRDPVAAPCAETGQQIGITRRFALQIAVGECPAGFSLQKCALRATVVCGFDCRVEICVH